MATVLFTAIGSLIGGPLGGAIGALVGRQIDGAIIGSPSREGPRLKELAVTTSSYGTPIARQFGQVRTAGTIIWATDLVEHRERSGGGKGRPKVTTYSYTSSFAVALSSRPVARIGRIWADGNLLRGAEGDLKVDGELRLHTGRHDQPRDPLIAEIEGAATCPAFRGTAYAVFEDLELSDFGNRIPALTFEVFTDEDPLTVAALAEGFAANADLATPLPGLSGLSIEGPLADMLATLDPLWPMDCDAGGDGLVVARERLQGAAIVLPEATVSGDDDAFGGPAGQSRKRGGPPPAPPEVLRYYDIARDYQPGAQRASGRPAEGQPRSLELPASLAADDARGLIEGAARRARFARDTMLWRSCELNARIAPGAVVALPGQSGAWRVTDWEWRAGGVELGLARLAPSAGFTVPDVDPGRIPPPTDAPAAETALIAFELPWDGTGGGDVPAVFAAVSSPSPRWAGAALFADQGDGALVPLGPSGRDRSTIGTAIDALAPGSAVLFDRTASVTVELLGEDMLLTGATARQIAMGANRALLGAEMIQFLAATPLGDRRWRLEGLLRGRGGSEGAISGHAASEAFVLLDGAPLPLDPALVGLSPEAAVAAIGRGDHDPVTVGVALRGWTLRPPSPVHPRARTEGGTLHLAWTRRARGAWEWRDGVDTPLQEQAEAYVVGYGPIEAPIAVWDLAEPQLSVSAPTLATLNAALPGGSFHVCQKGSYALSDRLLLHTLP